MLKKKNYNPTFVQFYKIIFYNDYYIVVRKVKSYKYIEIIYENKNC